MTTRIFGLCRDVEEEKAAAAWCKLGGAMATGEHVTINGEDLTRQEVWRRAVEANPSDPVAWRGLATTLTTDEVVVRGQPTTKLQCLLQVVVLDPDRSSGWLDLALAQSDDTYGHDAQQHCLQRSLDLDDTKPETWVYLGRLLSVGAEAVVKGKTFSKRQCFLRALRLDKSLAIAWYLLGTTLDESESVRVAFQPYTKQACCLRSVELFAGCAQVWYGLAATMAAHDVVMVKEERFTKEQVVARAAELRGRGRGVAASAKAVPRSLDVFG